MSCWIFMRNVYPFQELRGYVILLCFLSEKLKAAICTLESEIKSAAKCMHNFLKQGKHEAIFYFAMVAQSER